MTGGSIRRAARLAVSNAALEGEQSVTLAGVRTACRALNRQALDTLAVEITASGDWGDLAVGSQTLAELYNLESRCRRRESLGSAVGATLSAQLNPGVRALFSGPSGTGKTLAAKLLASALEKDLYRVDLATVVNKYIGETEKNLNEVFSRAEELDVLLLLDEGDALLAGRTNVQSSNDRYANLETNYLLQRIESYEGILIVTTNAVDRIDSAFQRRMDVVVDFRPPGAAERHAIWQLHLPARHSIDPGLLAEVAGRCALTGGQIRNAALHASLLAIEDGGVVTSSKIESAVQREYRKTGSVCPLRSASTVSFQ
jgi:SpoVK/Ycf46/Vps4 family AAA+-type ATPase